MIRKRRTLFVLLAVVIAGTALAAVTTEHLASDVDLLSFLYQTHFVAEGRIGDGAGAATFEVDLGEDTGAPAQTAQFAWPNGNTVDWELTYNNVTGDVVFTVDGTVVLNYTSAYLHPTEIFVRTRATKVDSDILVDNMVLDGMAVSDSSYAEGNGSGLDILWIKDGDLYDGFILTGQTRMSWGATVPNNSHLAFQIKVGNKPPVPTEKVSWGSLKNRFLD